jgi:hypothetical protein
MSKFVGTGPSSYKKRIYQASVSQRLRTTALGDLCIGERIILKCILNRLQRCALD